MLVQRCVTTKCNAHHKNHPANVKICFSFTNFFGLIWRGRDGFYKMLVKGWFTTKRSAHHKNHPCKNSLFFSNFFGLIWRGHGGFYKMLVQGYITTKCSAHHKNHPANVNICCSELFGSNLEGGAVGSTKCLCRDVSLQNAMRMANIFQKPASPASNLCSVSDRNSEHGFFEFA